MFYSQACNIVRICNGKHSVILYIYCVSALTPSAAGVSSAETMLVEEERTERRMAAEQNHQQQQSIQPLMTSLQTDQHQMSSLSPAVSERYNQLLPDCFSLLSCLLMISISQMAYFVFPRNVIISK